MDQLTRERVADAHHPFILASRVVGTAVYDRSGEKLGHVDDLTIEKLGGRTLYAIMSFGGFLGIGERFHPVPWSLLDYDEPNAAPHDRFAAPLTRAVQHYRQGVSLDRPVIEWFADSGVAVAAPALAPDAVATWARCE